MKKRLIVGTRGSRLALKQTEIAIEALKSLNPDIEVRVKVIKTTGDTIWDKPLHEIKGKGFFIKEIEEALIAKEIDIAVHSMKDVPTELKDGLKIAAVLERDDPRDAFVSFNYETLFELPEDSKIGTSSVRRTVQLLGLLGKVQFVPIRGNVETRIKKIATENLHGIILAYCGLKRLGLERYAKSIIPQDLLVPCAGQGAIGIEVREDSEFFDIVSRINHEKTWKEVELERKIQKLIGGGCHVPLGVNVESEGDFFTLYVFFGSQDGSTFGKIKEKGSWESADELARQLVEKLKAPRRGADTI
ncbi:MAG: hydroxymethylbilane synthase [Desulfobacterota bacterium]|nr:hydroxymethylbilane synthase [Thermodesulfobacteriota bacterium]MDW8002077.1 hydroxymethylbilane synthase [Deltaproteobacteria bacterium]